MTAQNLARSERIMPWLACAPISLLAVILATLALGLQPPAASAAGPLSWSPTVIAHQAPWSGTQLRAVSCPFASLCVAVDQFGNALVSTNPTGGAGAWTPIVSLTVSSHSGRRSPSGKGWTESALALAALPSVLLCPGVCSTVAIALPC